MFGCFGRKTFFLGNADVAFSLQVAKTRARVAAERTLRAEIAPLAG
jgi:hypothetical protein